MPEISLVELLLSKMASVGGYQVWQAEPVRYLIRYIYISIYVGVEIDKELWPKRRVALSFTKTMSSTHKL